MLALRCPRLGEKNTSFVRCKSRQNCNVLHRPAYFISPIKKCVHSLPYYKVSASLADLFLPNKLDIILYLNPTLVFPEHFPQSHPERFLEHCSSLLSGSYKHPGKSPGARVQLQYLYGQKYVTKVPSSVMLAQYPSFR